MHALPQRGHHDAAVAVEALRHVLQAPPVLLHDLQNEAPVLQKLLGRLLQELAVDPDGRPYDMAVGGKLLRDVVVHLQVLPQPFDERLPELGLRAEVLGHVPVSHAGAPQGRERQAAVLPQLLAGIGVGLPVLLQSRCDDPAVAVELFGHVVQGGPVLLHSGEADLPVPTQLLGHVGELRAAQPQGGQHEAAVVPLLLRALLQR
mmetsp:Transcript_28626/g.77588  ORF Transcript_28626/g.77588 Transcript_28626/m.77588 type:complete len:204 (-) Transcript_28626:197-808(-)